jgi:hypothetical protein
VLLATSSMLWGFGGRVTTSMFPSGWQEARARISSSDGSLLALPWHLYLQYDFADDRILSNLTPHAFLGEVVFSRWAELHVESETLPADPRELYVARVLEEANDRGDLGFRLAPLGVRYVGLGETADAEEYDFLDSQSDLTMIVNGEGFRLYENEEWRGLTYPVAALPDETSHGDLPGLHLARKLSGGVTLTAESAVATGTNLSCADGWRIEGTTPRCFQGAFGAWRSWDETTYAYRPGLILQLASYIASLAVAITLGYVALRRG